MIKGATHNDGWIYGKQQYVDQIKSFIDECSKLKKQANQEDEKENLIKDKDL